MTTRGKIVIGLLIVAALYFGINKLIASGIVLKKPTPNPFFSTP
jgi:hypothetical protein